MSTEPNVPDAKTVREIAQEQILNHVRNLAQDDERVYESVIEKDICQSMTDDEQQNLTDDVLAEIERAQVTVSWGAEQPQGDGPGIADEIAAELVATKDALNAAYRERAHLVALLAAVYPSHVGCTDPNAPGWAVVTLQLPTGQAAWHIAPDDEGMFQHVEQEPENTIPWDGHSTEEKYRRVDELTALLAEVGEPDSGVMAVPRFEIEQLERDDSDLYWPFTGASDVCYGSHDDGAGYRECCMRAGLAYALKLHAEKAQAERDHEIARLRRLLGIDIDRKQWDVIAEVEGARFEYEQTDDNLVGYLAYRYEDIKSQRHVLLREIEEAKASAKAERDGDVRAVAALWAAQVAGGHGWSEADALIARFADRIAALEARDAKEGE